jgi:nucleoid-associated protein YgaU
MGFAVGGVLLAVLVVAILVFHHGKNADKAVAFDAGGKPSIASGTDVNPPDSSPRTDAAGPTDVGAGTSATPAAPTNTSTEQKAPADDSAQKGGAQWDALFASTAADPIKAQLTSDPASKPKNKSKKHKSDGATADMGDKRDLAPANTVANAPLDSGSMLVDPAPRTQLGSNERSAAAASKESGRTHVVAQGETFVSIARAVYGDGRYYQALVDANPTVTPEKLKPGMTITLPPDSQVKESHKTSKPAAASSSKASDGKTYTVQSGDSLYKIAKKLYGNGEKSDDLYQANKQTIGPDSTRLKIGMVLTLPEAPISR